MEDIHPIVILSGDAEEEPEHLPLPLSVRYTEGSADNTRITNIVTSISRVSKTARSLLMVVHDDIAHAIHDLHKTDRDQWINTLRRYSMRDPSLYAGMQRGLVEFAKSSSSFLETTQRYFHAVNHSIPLDVIGINDLLSDLIISSPGFSTADDVMQEQWDLAFLRDFSRNDIQKLEEKLDSGYTGVYLNIGGHDFGIDHSILSPYFGFIINDTEPDGDFDTIRLLNTSFLLRTIEASMFVRGIPPMRPLVTCSASNDDDDLFWILDHKLYQGSQRGDFLCFPSIPDSPIPRDFVNIYLKLTENNTRFSLRYGATPQNSIP